MDKHEEKEEEKKVIQKHCFDQGYTAYQLGTESDSFITAVHHQVKDIPKYKDWTLENVKE